MGEPFLSAEAAENFQLRAQLFLAGELPRAELPFFNKQLAEHRSLREIFVDFAILAGLLMEHQLGSRLRDPMHFPPIEPTAPSSNPGTTLVGQRFAFDEEKDSSTLESAETPETPSRVVELPKAGPATTRPIRRPGAWFESVARHFTWRIAAAILLPLILAPIVWLVFHSSDSSATMARSVEAQWDTTGDAPKSDERLPAKLLKLKSGLVEMHLVSGASVIVEGPATFRAGQDNAVDLIAGRLTAIVPVSAHGFMVRTPSAVVVDLGTGFGVNVDFSGGTAVHVFEGHVDVAQRHGGNNGTVEQSPTKLSAGEEAMVADGVVKVYPSGATPQAFVRSLSTPSTIDMVDLICGGDGTTDRRSGGIDPRTGDSGLLAPAGVFDAIDVDYHAVPKLQVIDGCFVPNGEMKIDSAGHTFDFGSTTGQSFYDIRAGGTFAWPVPNEQFTAVLGDIDYSAAGHGLIFMQPNCGITFDLAALRRLHPGLKVSDFRAVVGNSSRRPAAGKANVLVLVDGVRRFEHRDIRQNDGRMEVGVPVTDSDRFLTIATTDQGETPTCQWIILGDPRLE